MSSGTSNTQGPLTAERLLPIAREVGTPVYVHDGDHSAAQVKRLAGFDVVRYAMKANSNVALLRLLRAAGAVADCVSLGEFERALAAGWAPGELCFTADLFERPTLARIVDEGLPVNVGSPDMIEQYAAAAGDRARGITLRINPGFGHGHSSKVNTGGEGTKHGIWHGELDACVARARAVGLEVTGLHMHIGSGTTLEHLSRTADAVVEHAPRIGSSLRAISGGGGLPVPYRGDEPEFDVEAFTGVWREAAGRVGELIGHRPQLEVEPGRFLVAQGGVLLAEVRAVKTVAGLRCLLVDAGFHNLCRPTMYGAFHRITVLGREGEPTEPTLVAGPLCESSDVLTQQAGGEVAPQDLPRAEVGDILCVHDTGAYGASMASAYNSMPIAPEVLLHGGEATLARPRTREADRIAFEEQGARTLAL